MLLILPLSIALMTPQASHGAVAAAPAPQSLRQAIAEALVNRSYLLLVLGFFTCGFQLQFITIHMPAYLTDRGMSAEVGGWTLGVIGLFNIVGSLGSGWLASFLPKRYILSAIYFARALAVLAFISFPVTPVTLHPVRRRHWLVVAVDRAADQRHRGGDLRHPLARDAHRLRLLQPSGRRIPRRLARRPGVRAHRFL